MIVMASVEKRVRGGKTTWVARWRDPDGKQRKRAFGKASEAKRHCAAMEADKARGSYVDGSDPTTVSEACWAWLERRTVRDRTHERYASLIRCHVEAVPLGTRRLVAVRNSEIQSWAADRGTVLGPATMRKLVRVLRAVFTDAVTDRVMPLTPFSGLVSQHRTGTEWCRCWSPR